MVEYELEQWNGQYLCTLDSTFPSCRILEEPLFITLLLALFFSIMFHC